MGKHVGLLGHIILIRNLLVLFLLINKVKHLHQPKNPTSFLNTNACG
jgi:hypothetical protein